MTEPAPTPTPAYLVLLGGCNTHKAGARFDLGTRPTVVGRVEGADIVLDHGTVSSRHARFEPRDDGWWVVDVGSTGGTFVNEEAIGYTGARRLVQGDMVGLG